MGRDPSRLARPTRTPAMSDHTFNTVMLQRCLDRMRAGDTDAENDLVKAVQARLRALVARMYRGFPNVRLIADADDVFQESVIRLLASLRAIRPATTRDFVNFAAVHIRRELLDLARRAKGKQTVPLDPPGSTDSPGRTEPAAPEEGDLDDWVELHEAIDQLPSELREVVGLVFYHGWKQEQVAELLKVSVRTVRRWWHAACEQIRKRTGIDIEAEGPDG
jgi:RNA polymerase sigma factor (sigma-70 family)